MLYVSYLSTLIVDGDAVEVVVLAHLLEERLDQVAKLCARIVRHSKIATKYVNVEHHKTN